MRYLDFDIEIGEGLGRSYPVVVRSAAGDAHVTMQFPFDDGALENLLLKLRNVQHKALPEVKQAVQDFGRQLFEALLPDEARSLFYACHNRAIQERLPGIRIRLHIQEPKLATLPWEYLYDFSSGGYLCLLRSSPVVRRLELPLSTIPLKIKLPLRILGMFASPSDQRTLDIGREQTRMERAVMDLMASGQIELTWLEGQTWEDLQKALQSGHWHIFHFMGHAGFDSFTKEGLIALSDRNGKTHLLSASELALLLKNNGSIRLAVLNACEGAKGSRRDIFSSTAATLARLGIPAVLAMQEDITDRAATQLTNTFYRALANGLPVDAAVSEARAAMRIAMKHSLEWGTPVLYLCAPDGILFTLNDTETPTVPNKDWAKSEGTLIRSDPPLQRKIADMRPGETAYTVPWAMEIDNDGQCYLNVNHDAMEQPYRETVQMLVKRELDGWHVDIQRCRNHKWSKREVYGPNYEPIKELIS